MINETLKGQRDVIILFSGSRFAGVQEKEQRPGYQNVDGSG